MKRTLRILWVTCAVLAFLSLLAAVWSLDADEAQRCAATFGILFITGFCLAMAEFAP